MFQGRNYFNNKTKATCFLIVIMCLLLTSDLFWLDIRPKHLSMQCKYIGGSDCTDCVYALWLYGVNITDENSFTSNWCLLIAINWHWKIVKAKNNRWSKLIPSINKTCLPCTPLSFVHCSLHCSIPLVLTVRLKIRMLDYETNIGEGCCKTNTSNVLVKFR